MNLGITDRVAVITGGSRGIGLAVAQELLDNGARVAIVARNELGLEAAVATLNQPTDRVLAISADVSLEGAAASILKKSISTFGQVDILVNNAGRAHAGGLMDASETDWEEMIAVKLTAMRRLCKAVLPGMQARRWGRIVNMSSVGGHYPNPKLFISHVLSAAINNFTKSLALEIAADAILVNAIGIGAVATDKWETNMIPAVRRNRPDLASLSDEQVLVKISAEYTPIGRAGEPREIAALAAFLVSDRNGFVTGDTIDASGGADRFM